MGGGEGGRGERRGGRGETRGERRGGRGEEGSILLHSHTPYNKSQGTLCMYTCIIYCSPHPFPHDVFKVRS